MSHEIEKKGKKAKLDLPTIQQKLQEKDVEGWTITKDISLQKSFIFSTFKAALTFVHEVAHLADQQQHHPKITIDFRQVTLTLMTHEVHGVSEADIDLIEPIEAIFLSHTTREC